MSCSWSEYNFKKVQFGGYDNLISGEDDSDSCLLRFQHCFHMTWLYYVCRVVRVCCIAFH